MNKITIALITVAAMAGCKKESSVKKCYKCDSYYRVYEKNSNSMLYKSLYEEHPEICDVPGSVSIAENHELYLKARNSDSTAPNGDRYVSEATCK